MADFVAVLRKTLDGLGETTPEMRARVYDKARATVQAKLSALNPQPPAAVADRQRKALEDAIASVESEYAPAKPAFEDPLEELESVFAALKEGKPLASSKPAAPKPAPAAATAGGIPAPARSSGAPAPERSTPPKEAARQVASPPAPARASAAAPQTNGSALPKAPPPQMPAARHEPVFPPVGEPDFPEDDEDDIPAAEQTAYPRYEERKRGGRSYGGLIAAVLALLVIGGAGYGVWLNRDAFGKMLDVGDLLAKFGKSGATESAAPPPTGQTDVASAEGGQKPPVEEQPEAGQPEKFTQRLNADGTETDAGPGGTQQAFGEGTSVASLTAQETSGQAQTAPPVSSTPPAADGAAQATPAEPQDAAPASEAAAPPSNDAAGEPAPPADGQQAGENGAAPPSGDAAAGQAEPDGAAPPAGDTPPAQQAASAEAAAGQQQQVAVGQRAIFYEERTNTSQGSAEPGSIVWSEVKESPGGDLPPEPAIRAEATIPGKDIQLRMTIRRNLDKTLPASHIIEMIFLTPEGFEGGGIDNVLRVAFKGSEQDAGNPLLGIPAKISDGFFLVALNDSKDEIETNLNLLKQRSWIDIPIVYKSGRRALITLEKGLPGEKVFDDTLKAWEQPKTAG